MARTTYLVDDHEGVRTAIRRLLELRPDQIVRDFESGEGFLAEADGLEPGVLLLDLNMPGLSGLEVLEALQSRHRGKFIVLILTGTDTVPHALGPMRGGVFRFIEKPCDAQKLFDTVDAAHVALLKVSAGGGYRAPTGSFTMKLVPPGLGEEQITLPR
ncbi:MAG: response regulator [Sphingomonas sp.]